MAVTWALALYHVPLFDLEASRIRLSNEGQQIASFTIEEMAGLPLTANLGMLFNEYRDNFTDSLAT